MKNIFDQKNLNLIFLSVLLFLSGFLFFAFYNNWLVLFLPSYNVETLSKEKIFKQEKKDVFLHYWKDKKWNKETINLLWCDENNADNIKYLINGFLNLLEEEKISKQKVVLQSVLISSSGQQAYLSFDRNPLTQVTQISQGGQANQIGQENQEVFATQEVKKGQDCSVYDKLMFIEGILKTIRENNINVTSVSFLVRHQAMQDYHLDFSNPWPIHGFLS